MYFFIILDRANITERSLYLANQLTTILSPNVLLAKANATKELVDLLPNFMEATKFWTAKLLAKKQ